SQMRDHRIDLRGGQLVGERRHDPRETAAATTVADDRPPIDIQLRRRGGARAEIGKGARFVETDGRVRSALPVGPVTSGAPAVVDRVAAREIAGPGLSGKSWSAKSDDQRKLDDGEAQVAMYDTSRSVVATWCHGC